ncbi:hypothetical protein HU200_043361 [Digitaria exilis]|uniref:F-box domain-containing protein n=1 Tax=Digitaria exilis TaxID=1010633 RepID=A0A835B953_9POAL|nr:hypothetical protein HU200_043361 [Digitaria exilis]
MEPGGGGGQDRLSALPDDVLVLILLRLDTTTAGRTSILSHRWRRIWALLPELRFPADADLRLVASALAAHEAPISYLDVRSLDAVPESVEACLALAAGRLSGSLVFQNRVSPGGNAGGGGDGGTLGFDLTCLHNATAVSLDLGLLGLAVLTTGVFARLTELSLERVRFRSWWELGDAVSSPRCPCLQKLSVIYAHGLANLAIHSESLLQLKLKDLYGLQQLTIVAQVLNELDLGHCFGADGGVVAHISTPQLVSLFWVDLHDSTSVQLGNWPRLQNLTSFFLVYAPHDSLLNHSFLRLLKQFQFIKSLHIRLVYLEQNIGNLHYALEDLTKLPCITALSITVNDKGHAFGASLFNILRICSDLRFFVLELDDVSDSEVPYECPSGCVCDQPSDWKTEEFTLNCLQGASIDMEGSDPQIAFVKRLLTWAVALKHMQINFDSSMSECKVMELRQTLSSFAGPETRVNFYMYENEGVKFLGTRYLLAP